MNLECGECLASFAWHFLDNHKKVQTFPWGGELRPPDPPSSQLLSQPPQARFEGLSKVGRCRGLQGWEVLGHWFGR